MKSIGNDERVISTILLISALIAYLIFWFAARHIQTQWLNVPSPPSMPVMSAFAGGDRVLAHRVSAFMLQSFGDTGGRSTRFIEYNYDALKSWFFVSDALDDQSRYVPVLAGYYYGAVKDPDRLRYVVEYLEHIGSKSNQKEGWRWLTHAVYLTRYEIGDLDKALDLAQTLADLPYTDRPGWTYQMPALILADQGKKEQALGLMLQILKSSANTLHPNEIHSMKIYVCTHLLDDTHPIHKDLCDA